ncbi:MAG: hypothetical protein JSW39_00010 [Desulfobacterales bacterium]|nr:MAG: hypothetical protein JSW39_00010 [Desulfobacterales bacterium]
MRKPAYYFVAIILGAGLLFDTSSLLWAQAPQIRIELNLDKTHYTYGEPIGATVVVSNQSGGAILVNKGFSSMVYYLEMRVIDPAGKLTVAKREAFHDEFPDAPPLAWILHAGKPIRVVGCESLPAGWTSDPSQGRIDDMREPYRISLPGHYSAQVQLSVMTFASAPCEVDDYEWQGVLESETVYFYYSGAEEFYFDNTVQMKVNPAEWELSWKKDKKVKKLQVQIMPQLIKIINDYDIAYIELNGIPALDWKRVPPKFKVYFDRKLVLEALGDVDLGQSYPAVVSGRFTNERFFGGGQQIKIVE